jgi:DNA primase
MTVEELLNKQDIAFTPKGQDYLVRCLNPDHEDSNPSMRIDCITGIFGCFSCGHRGNLFTLFGEKANQLQLRRELLKAKIIQKRSESIGLSFPKGYLPYVGDWRGLKPSTYAKFEAFQHHDTDFIGRIVFPIRNITGNISAFQGRHTTEGIPKYKIYPQKAKLPLFPVVEPVQGSIVLVEGIFDMLNLHDKGMTNAVCAFGTNNIQEDKLRILQMQSVDTVVIFFDGDDAGQAGADGVKELCDRVGLIHKNVCINGADPGSLSQIQVTKLKSKLYE